SKLKQLLLGKYVPDITWKRDRGNYHFIDMTDLSVTICHLIILIKRDVFVLIQLTVKIILTSVMHQVDKRSKQSIRAIRKSLITLFMQAVCLASFGVINIHSIFHNILILSLTPAYRQFIINVIRCVLENQNTPISKQTPPHESTFGNYLIYIQVLITLNDVFIDVLSQPVPLFPAPCGFCIGILCSSGIISAIIMLLLNNTGISIIVCCMHRHQSIVFASSSL
ncbi:hypothetical protein PENTCL1PPCAC_14703, partial [Pristionchus entomophagus]